MITLHEVKVFIQQMAVMSNYIIQLNQMLPQVVQLVEQIDSINEELTIDRDRMTAKMRATEVLGEIIKTRVYQNTLDTTPDSPHRQY
ncbi:MAG: hypothetical protein AB1483_10180 [Candidatus Zixiibacteriota bacterium]